MIKSTELINFYNMTIDEINTLVRLLNEQNIPLIIVRLNAFSEWSSGTSSGISKVKQIIEIANSKSIQVAVDLHTWYTTWDSYFRDSASSSSSNRTKYITYVRNVLTELSTSNVHSFMVMNEPQARTASSNENQFILNVIEAAKQITSKQISVRFMGGYSPTTGHYSSTIDQACDFICRNSYWDARSPDTAVYGTTEIKLLNAISSAHIQNKQFWITEFGKVKSNLEEQRSYVEALVKWADNVEVDAVFCWVSQPDVSGENYNIFNGYEPNPAFYELTNDIVPPPPVPKQYSLTINESEYGYTNPASGILMYTEGTIVSIEATPKEGYTFLHWIINSEIFTNNPISITLNINTVVTPVFQEIPSPPTPPEPVLPNPPEGFEWINVYVLKRK